MTGIAGDSDVQKLHDDIALLHFLRSIDSSSKIANMIEGWSDTFPNTTSVVANSSVVVPLTLFDGTTDYMTRGADLTGSVDGKSGTCSFWLDINGLDSTKSLIYYGQGGFIEFAALYPP